MSSFDELPETLVLSSGCFRTRATLKTLAEARKSDQPELESLYLLLDKMEGDLFDLWKQKWKNLKKIDPNYDCRFMDEIDFEQFIQEAFREIVEGSLKKTKEISETYPR